MAKADTISMNMLGKDKSWTHFIYLTLPSQLITNYMTQVHDNDDISIAKKYIREVEETYGDDGWRYNNWKKIEAKYDKKYPEFSTYTDAYETHKCIKWKQDFRCVILTMDSLEFLHDGKPKKSGLRDPPQTS